MKETEIAPDPHLMESMRAVGYTLETAVADVIDNSITAEAMTIDVLFSAAPSPYVAILDDGKGMTAAGLQEAMRLAGRSPLDSRRDGDLGRFGLGLKTASLSQCRVLTVLSKVKGGDVIGVRWSLDHLAATGRWALLILSKDECSLVPHADLLKENDSGTLVVWTDLDQLHVNADERERELDEQMARVRDHLALVFHRFTSDPKTPLLLRINGSAVPAVDPFLSAHRATQKSPLEQVTIAGVPVSLEAFTLPYVSKLSQRDRETAQIAGPLRDSQGFYIYRSRRLVIWGTWFRIVPKDDLGKLARVRVDIPNSLDHLWSLDIKKSTAVPPPEVRSQLRRLATNFVTPSTRTHKYRGRPIPSSDSISRLWSLIEERGTFRYELNRQHPVIDQLAAALSDDSLDILNGALQVIESTFPVEDAYNRLGSDNAHRAPNAETPELEQLTRLMWRSMQPIEDVDALADRLRYVEPFSALPDIEKYLRKVLSD
ncbi:ATP-binding protein [Nocardioides sp. J54]|uniref:ATP-binding protein n=1 Tax=Nocardioides sp. J54 TaxID=935866 RepID=UPI00048D2CEB|nr:ATP-binding protein [Nocardioides sp. J54]